MLKLDFSLETSKQRNELVSNFFEQNPDYVPTQHELDTISNYILYGKDEDGTSVTDRREVEIDTKYSSYKRRKTESLDELMEKPGFNENSIVTQYVYRVPKPSIDREVDCDIPGMRELWVSIDRLKYVLDVYDGKAELKDGETLPQYSSTQIYKLRHLLIELRKQQYQLKYSVDAFGYNPSVRRADARPTDSYAEFSWDGYWFYPLGLVGLSGDDGRFTAPAEQSNKVSKWDRHRELSEVESKYKVVDFSNSEHIYLISKMYQELLIAAQQDSDSVCGHIVKTIDFYVNEAGLSDVKKCIWEMKCRRIGNTGIREMLREKFGVGYNENYISTIFKQNVCNEIADLVKLRADYYWNRDDEGAWKVCSRCGRKKLRDSREFMRKSKSSDGLATRCKECEKIVRAEAKKKKEEKNLEA